MFFCLLTFTTVFFYNNSPDALGDSYDKLEGYSTNIQSSLLSIEDESDVYLNITSETNPEISDLGSRDSVATSYGITGNSRTFWESSKSIIGWVFTGTTGQILLSVFGGLFGFTALYYITKWIRNGL